MDFQCNRCGNCCRVTGYVRLKTEEPQKIAQFLKMPVRDFIERYTRITEDRIGLSLNERPDHSCIFLRPDGSCLIQPVKPIQCKRFPHQWNYEGWEELCGFHTQGKNKKPDLM